MLVGGSEGRMWRYEVVDRSEGFLVRLRDLETGALDEEDEAKLFRTAAVAFAYADMSAALERYAAALSADGDADEARAELTRCTDRYHDVSARLLDTAANAAVLNAWDEDHEERRRRRYH